MRDPLEGDGPCAGCAAGPPAVTAWSPAFGAVLCGSCRATRTARDLAATERANAGARLAAARAAETARHSRRRR